MLFCIIAVIAVLLICRQADDFLLPISLIYFFTLHSPHSYTLHSYTLLPILTLSSPFLHYFILSLFHLSRSLSFSFLFSPPHSWSFSPFLLFHNPPPHSCSFTTLLPIPALSQPSSPFLLFHNPPPHSCSFTTLLPIPALSQPSSPFLLFHNPPPHSCSSSITLLSSFRKKMKKPIGEGWATRTN